jgi:hypothetical protein
MALGTGAAQAEVGSHWNVAGKAIPSGLLPFVQVKEIEELKAAKDPGKHLVLYTHVLGGTLVKLLCTNAELEEFHLLTEGGSLGKIKFTGCEFYLTEVGKTEFLSAACEPKTGTETGVILTNLLKDLIVLHELKPSGVKDTLDRIEPSAAGGPWFTIESSKECAYGAKANVGGVLFLKDCQNEFGVEKVEHLVEEGPLTHLWLLSDTVEHASTIVGSTVLALTDFGAEKHRGLKWSGTAI